jgi:N-acetylglutamate synthase-like GNAT family acetyltransferase
VLKPHSEVCAEESDWDASFDSLVSKIRTEFVTERDPAKGNAWIAEQDGKRVGCEFCVKTNETVAQLRFLLLRPGARGNDLDARLVDECDVFARNAGH